MPAQRHLAATRGSSKSSPTVHVLVVDDHRLVRQEIRSVVNSLCEFTVVGEAEDGAQACELAQQLQPDVILMDIHMPNMKGIEATRWIRAHLPPIAIIGLSVNQSITVADQMKEAGASAYLTKETPPEDLCRAIHAALNKPGWLSTRDIL